MDTYIDNIQLPFNQGIVNRIIEYAWHTIDYCVCSTEDVYGEKLRRRFSEQRTSLARLQLIEYAQRVYEKCPFHSLYDNRAGGGDESRNRFYQIIGINDRGHDRNGESDRDVGVQFPDRIPPTPKDRWRWRLKLSTISKDTRQFVLSHLFTDIIICNGRPQVIAGHLTNMYSPIKNIRSLTIPLSLFTWVFRGLGDKNNEAILENCTRLEITNIDNPNRQQQVDTFGQVVSLPTFSKVNSLVLLGTISKDKTLIHLLVHPFHCHQKLVSINLLGMTTTEPTVTYFLGQLDRPLLKLLLPYRFNHLQFSYLKDSIKQSLQLIFISFNQQIYQNNNNQNNINNNKNNILQFKNLKHIYIDTNNSNNVTFDNLILPCTITKITTNYSSFPTPKFLHSNNNITHLNIKDDNWDTNRMTCRSISFSGLINQLADNNNNNIKKIMIEYEKELTKDDIEMIDCKGFKFNSSKFNSNNTRPKQIILTRRKKNQKQVKQQQQQQQSPIILPHVILYQIIVELWKSYTSLCTCRVWDDRLWDCFDTSMVEVYRRETNQCPQHHHQDTVFFTTKESRSKQLELMLISWYITKYLRTNFLLSHRLEENTRGVFPIGSLFTQGGKGISTENVFQSLISPSIQKYSFKYGDDIHRFNFDPKDPSFPSQLVHLSVGSLWDGFGKIPLISSLTVLDMSRFIQSDEEYDYASKLRFSALSSLTSLVKLYLPVHLQERYMELTQSTKDRLQAISLNLRNADRKHIETVLLASFKNLNKLRLEDITFSPPITLPLSITVLNIALSMRTTSIYHSIKDNMKMLILNNHHIKSIKIQHESGTWDNPIPFVLELTGIPQNIQSMSIKCHFNPYTFPLTVTSYPHEFDYVGVIQKLEKSTFKYFFKRI
ncbi:hypothetical protein DFA_03825 [Cavenderia fasciculata]|uniref:Uncharacterized protein n=1 Tax=Cavenderia fasciculata TaxID=261658 RepID=F4Q0I0_CACFS|nr:uncharacterized protein DFA_03825 [Cavenderia fasciculata]EGG18331.1 hypothetical protein DFA_03825 [Cavenderia fasciculata]|eukprot:XP_004366235.1 hypothetical protein DFA_03825 [Cavenderia fasciculata]